MSDSESSEPIRPNLRRKRVGSTGAAKGPEDRWPGRCLQMAARNRVAAQNCVRNEHQEGVLSGVEEKEFSETKSNTYI